ncbi:hypothetical protein G6L37_02640 [Agrobacterium rubi]|nr:hypothetical protein [Agrobacterium rubi]NTF24294.1 hypothetical protein [Agrobacterium rubi]
MVSIDINEYCAESFRRAAASLGLSQNVLGARIDLTAEKARGSVDPGLPDHLYFRGYAPSKGEFSFALSAERHTGLHRGQPEVRFVAWRYINRVLSDPANVHLLERDHVLSDMTQDEFTAKLVEASRDLGVPDHVREILAEAASRNNAPRENPQPHVHRTIR